MRFVTDQSHSKNVAKSDLNQVRILLDKMCETFYEIKVRFSFVHILSAVKTPTKLNQKNTRK